MSECDWSLPTKLAKAGFDLDSIPLGNSFGIQQGSLGFGRQDAERPTSKDAVSCQLKMAGLLWSICKDYEMELPSIKIPDSFHDRMTHAKVCRESDVLLCRLKVTCAEIWVGLYASRKDKWPMNVLLDLISWLLEASESLIGLRQWSTVNSLLGHVETAAGTLEEMVQNASAGGSQDRIFFSDDDSQPCTDCERACLLWVKAKVISFQVVMQLKGSMDWKIGHDRLQDILNGIPDRCMKVSMCMEYQRLTTSVVVHFIKSSQCEEASHILESLLKFHGSLSTTEEPISQRNINDIVATRRRKCSMLLVWCQIHAEGSFQASSLPGPLLVELPGVIAEWLQKFDSIDLEDYEACLDASRYLDRYLKQNAKAPRILESCAWACTQLLHQSRWKWMPHIISQYAHMHSIQKDYREIFMVWLVRCLCCIIEEPSFFECSEKCEAFHAIVSNENVVQHLKHRVELSNEAFKMVWNVVCEITDIQSCLQPMLATALLLAEITQDIDSISNILVCLSRMYFRENCHEQALHYLDRAERLNPTEAHLARLELALENKTDQSTIEKSIQLLLKEESTDLRLASYFVCLTLENENYPAAALILENILRLILVCDDDRFNSCEPKFLVQVFLNYYELIHRKLKRNSGPEFIQWITLMLERGHLAEIPKSLESHNEVKYLVGHAWCLAKEELDARHGLGQASTILFLASKLLDLIGHKDMEIQLMSQMMFGLASVISVIFTNDSIESEQNLTEIVSSLRDKQALLRSNTEKDDSLPSSSILEEGEFLRQYLSIILLIRQQHDNMALDILRDIQEQMTFEHLMILLEELKGPYAGEVPCARTYKAVLSHIVRSHHTRAVQNPTIFADVIAEYLHIATGQEFFEMLSKTHSFIKSIPKGTFPRYFLEWMYTASWNFAHQEHPDGSFAEDAVCIAREGFQRENLLSEAEQTMLFDTCMETPSIL